MKKETIIEIIIFLMVFIIVIFVFMLSINKMKEQLLYFCRGHNWEGTHNVSGDFSGEFNCTELRIELFDNKGWTKECSTLPFSLRLSCHTLCNMDCEIKNKKAGETKCIC
jgi:hypothetical protein